MKTPICDFVNKYANKGNLRLHMPGHKGISFLGVEEKDITEVDGADVLYSANGIIEQSLKNAASVFGSGETFYSTEGSSLCIRAMIYLVALLARENGKRPLVLAARNAHKSFISALAFSDVDVEWIYPDIDESLISCRVAAEQIEQKFSEMKELPTAVYITSPDYLGTVSDIGGISAVCKRYGVVLIVDNAHGAYLRFLPESKHPIDLGADMCCDSAHKTLPVLTGGAYLHISKNAPKLFFEMARQSLSLFASTSPSYLILQSLDMANLYLFENYKERLALTVKAVRDLKLALADGGFSLVGDEEMKICIKAKEYGYFGFEISEYLAKKGIVCEFCDRDYLVMMFTPETDVNGIEKLSSALLSLTQRAPVNEAAPLVGRPEAVMSVREATLSPSEEVDVENSLGRILFDTELSCPPAIPIVVCGERIDQRAVECFKYYGISKCRVID